MFIKNEIIKSIIPPLSIKQEIAKTCFVSDSDGCIYKEGTREECEGYVSEERESGMLEFLPPLSIYTKEEWFYFFGAIE